MVMRCPKRRPLGSELNGEISSSSGQPFVSSLHRQTAGFLVGSSPSDALRLHPAYFRAWPCSGCEKSLVGCLVTADRGTKGLKEAYRRRIEEWEFRLDVGMLDASMTPAIVGELRRRAGHIPAFSGDALWGWELLDPAIARVESAAFQGLIPPGRRNITAHL